MTCERASAPRCLGEVIVDCWLVLALLLGVPGCASQQVPRVPERAVPEVTVVPEFDPSALSKVEQLGFGIYCRYAAARWAEDALISAGHSASRSTDGWIAVPRGELWLVRFVDPEGRVPFEVVVDVRSSEPEDVVIHRPPASLSVRELGMWRARQMALGSGFRACSPSYEAVVVPEQAGGRSPWIVYLLAESTGPDEVMLGGHHRIRVSESGSKILTRQPLTRSCMTSKLGGDGAILGVTHVISEEPMETHVFLSLLHGIPVGVATNAGLWLVERGRIRPLSRLP